MIHKAIKKAEVAKEYYNALSIKYKDSEQYRKQFHQDKNIDKKVLRMVLKKIYKEQDLLLKEA